ncbi:MAG: DUF433 domain-containing protein [Candidatus Nitrosocaldus sp.]
MSIVIDPDICNGKPVIKGTRITVEFILELLANGWSYEDVTKNYGISKEDILEALAYAAELMREEKVYIILSNQSKPITQTNKQTNKERKKEDK